MIVSSWSSDPWTKEHVGRRVQVVQAPVGNSSRHTYQAMGTIAELPSRNFKFRPDDANHPSGKLGGSEGFGLAACGGLWRFIDEIIDSTTSANPQQSTKEKSMDLQITVARTIDGWVGQILDEFSDTIVWESDPFLDLPAEGDKPAVTGVELARKAARDKRAEVIKELFS